MMMGCLAVRGITTGSHHSGQNQQQQAAVKRVHGVKIGFGMLFLCRFGKIFFHLSIYQYGQQGFRHPLWHPWYLFVTDQLVL
jgi:hypothetical protein